MFVSIVIPAYKQEKTIRRNIKDVYDVMSKSRWEFEIIVVVDGYVDKTFEEASLFKKDNVFVVGYETNQGKGFAVKYGMYQALGDYVAFIDAGIDINLNSISMLLEHMEWYKADVVVGSKRHPVSIVDYSPLRRLYSWAYHTYARVLLGIRVKDTQAGLKVYRREVLDTVLPRLMVKEFAFDVEMLAVTRRLGFTRIFEAPIDLKLGFNGTSFTKTILLDPYIRRMLIDTLAVFYRLQILKYYDDGNERRWLQNEASQMVVASKKLSVIERAVFSIIITARRYNKYLMESIGHIKKLDYPYFEVIIVLDEDEGEDMRVDDRFRVVVVGDRGPAEKRNIGASISEGNVLVFLDDDAYPKRDWLRHAAEIFQNSQVFALGAPALTPRNAKFLERLSGRLLESKIVSGWTTYRHLPEKARIVHDYPTVNLFVRGDSFNSVGGFITEFWPGEDTKLCLDLVNKHRRGFLYDPRPIVYHHRRNVLLPHLKQVSRYGQHRGQFARIFPQTSRLLSYFIPSLFLIGFVTGPIAALIFPSLWYVYFFVLLLYVFLLLQRALRVLFDEKRPFSAILTFLGILLTHFAYGANFLIGLIRRPKLKLREIDMISGDYLGG